MTASKKNLFAGLTIMLITICFSLICLEIFVRIFYPQNLVLVDPSVFGPDSHLGWKHRPEVKTKVMTPQGKINFHTDKNGYRIDPLHYNPDAEIRILSLGDSFTEAIQVDDDKTATELIARTLEEKYNKTVYVCNTGVGDWDPNQYLIQARIELNSGKKYNLGIVFFYLGNDIVSEKKDHFPRRQSRLRKFKNIGSFLAYPLYPINDFLQSRSHLFILLKNGLRNLRIKLGLSPYPIADAFFTNKYNDKMWNITGEICSEINAEFQKHNIPVFFVLIPTNYQVDTTIFNKFLKLFNISSTQINLEQPNTLMAKELSKRRIEYIDILNNLRAKHNEGIQLYGEIDPHFNENGLKYMAELILPIIEKKLSAQHLSCLK